MKKLLAVLAIFVAGLGIWGGYLVFIKQPHQAEFYIDKVNQALLENQPQLAFDYVNQGIIAYPQRLDLRFGKVYMCQMLADYRCMKDEISKILSYSAAENHQWRWLKNEAKDKDFMLEVIQNYQKFFWETGQDEAMNDVAVAVLQYYPDHVESLNAVAVGFLAKGDWKNAEPYLLNAKKLAPDDEIVKVNFRKMKEIKSAK